MKIDMTNHADYNHGLPGCAHAHDWEINFYSY
jgi:hypothetical protein